MKRIKDKKKIWKEKGVWRNLVGFGIDERRTEKWKEEGERKMCECVGASWKNTFAIVPFCYYWY